MGLSLEEKRALVLDGFRDALGFEPTAAQMAQPLLTLASTFSYGDFDGHIASRDFPEKEARMYFAQHCDTEVESARQWQQTPLRDAVRWVDGNKHGFFADSGPAVSSPRRRTGWREFEVLAVPA